MTFFSIRVRVRVAYVLGVGLGSFFCEPGGAGGAIVDVDVGVEGREEEFGS